MLYCSKCGHKIEIEADYCPKCGNVLEKEPVKKEPVRASEQAPQPPGTGNENLRNDKPSSRRNKSTSYIILGIVVVIGIVFACVAFWPTSTPTNTYIQCSTGYSTAVNDPSMCCQNGFPYYWSSDGKCHTSAWTASTAIKKPITFTLNRIETSADCEPAIKGDGEFYFMAVVVDGNSYSTWTAPSNREQGGYYALGNYEGVDFNQVLFSTSDVGDYLQVVIIGFEQDSTVCYGDIAESLGPDLVDVMYPGWGGAAEWLLAQVNESRAGQSWGCDADDFAGEYENTWYASQNHGIGSHEVTASPYLTVWFTIE